MKKFAVSALAILLAASMLAAAACTPEDETSQTDPEGSAAQTEEQKTDAPDEGVGTDTEADDTDAETDENSDADGESLNDVPTETETGIEFESETETETETDEKEDRPVYEDLSAQNSPTITVNSSTKISVTVDGGTLLKTALSFESADNGFKIGLLDIPNIDDCSTCSSCGFKEIDGEGAYYICPSTSQAGMILTLDTPIPSELLTSMSVTYRTSREVTNSQIRVLTQTGSTNSGFINDCPSMAGAVDEWKTVDLGMTVSDIKQLADEDGMIRAFKFYFRNKDDTDIYVKEISFAADITDICRVDAIDGVFTSRGEALEKLAQVLKERLEAAGVACEATVRLKKYQSNTSAEHGELSYGFDATLDDGSEISISSHTTVFRRAEGIWLELSDGEFGAQRDSLGQWQDTFLPSGVITLEDNVIKCAEGVRTVEYAVVSPETDVTDTSVDWFTPHLLEMNEDGISKLFVNAFLDYGYALESGKDYRFLIRGITNNDNLILHLDIPFTYSPLSEEHSKKLDSAMEAIADVELFPSFGNGEPKSAIEAAVKSVVGDGVKVIVDELSWGAISGKYRISFVISDAVSSQSFTLDGEERRDFFNFVGSSFSFTETFVFEAQTADIVLVSPSDGEEDIRIASADTVRFWDSDTVALTTALHAYPTGEACHPVPVVLAWHDSVSGASYTVTVSENADLSDPFVTVSADGSTAEIYNLKRGTRYYWQVSRGGENSAVFSFVTENEYPRYIKTEKVSNFRDIGGYTTTDGKTVAQGLAFRLSNFNSVNDSDRAIIAGDLGLRTELDLTGGNSSSPLGSEVNAIPVSIQWYAGIFNEGQSEPLRQAISVFAYEENYPIGFHCAIGRDRTGTVSILLLGLLGVDEDTILKEYLISKNSVSGSQDGVSATSLHNNYKSLINRLHTYGDEDDSFAEKVETYLLSIGVTAEEIASIRRILLED